jgi:hypothetical protein
VEPAPVAAAVVAAAVVAVPAVVELVEPGAVRLAAALLLRSNSSRV